MGNEASRDGVIASDTEEVRASTRRSTMKPPSGSMDFSSGGEVEYTANGRVRRKRGNNLMGQRLGSLDDYNFKTFPKSPLQKQLLLDALKGAWVGYQHEAPTSGHIHRWATVLVPLVYSTIVGRYYSTSL